MLAGGAIVVLGLPDLPFFWHRPFSYSKQAELKPGDADFPKLESRYPLDKLTRYAITRDGGNALTLPVADYRDAQGQTRRAMVNLPTNAAVPGPTEAAQQLRHDIWARAAKSIASHVGPHALFLSWWDDGQRLHLLSGADSWGLLPDAEGWRDGHERQFWLELAGGRDDGQKQRQLARWLTMDAAQAVKEMAEAVPKDKDAYVLVTVDDLARLGEIENLAGVSLPLETQVFPSGENFHALIAQVKRWAGESERTGKDQNDKPAQQEEAASNYLVQQLPGVGVRAWRVADPKANDLLITRLLPFTGSLNRPLEGLQLVYQSEQAYLSVYRLAKSP
ncbi:hypothetical protein MoryE10_01010 [Methylogaea oryzae]|uniref:Hydroxylamine oxidation protein HaoB n=1 Tax=Methylogaea oryzae TaxID=1295382 RepID=A0A8D5AKU1_9GAMM|nr:hypothetical protein MoryE10_01010 [Methylogaea oryzae]